MMRARVFVLGALLAVAAPLAPSSDMQLGWAAGNESAIRSGDRVVFFGDSITEQRYYTRFVQQYVYVRHPEWDIRFFNAGWGGDTATSGLARLERDVLWLKPTLVTLFFGMNDGGYKAADPPTTADYKTSLTGIVTALKAKGVRVVVFTPGCCDVDKAKNLADVHYQDTLEGLAKTALDVAREQGVAGIDVFHPMLAFQTERKKADPQFSMIPDGVHPSPAGHVVMAKVFLESLGLEPFPVLGRVDLEAAKSDTFTISKKSDAEYTLTTRTPPAIPFWVAPGSTDVAEGSGFLDSLAGQKWLVSGLAPGDWELSIDGTAAGRWLAAELARGVAIPGTWSAGGREVHDLIIRRENEFFDAWRNVKIPFAGRPGLEHLMDGLMTADEGWHQLIRLRPAPERNVTFLLTRAPAGDNLALRKDASSSESHGYGWGEAGLTDGSWEGDSEHCFATGSSTRFPKNVTIDLEKAVRIATVRLGVPEFGSTKVVAVSESIDGKKYREVGRVEFRLRRAERRTVTFEPKTARYVRLTYVDHYDEQVGYSENSAFTTEVEVYGPGK